MPRRARMYIPDLPYHVVQRGNNREACFIEPENYQYYLELWQDVSRRYDLAVLLLPDDQSRVIWSSTLHVHLLVTPSLPHSISHIMQDLGRKFVRYINRTYRRTGSLWEGRFKASLVDSEAYLLTCMRYIEMNPVRAGMVVHPGDF